MKMIAAAVIAATLAAAAPAAAQQGVSPDEMAAWLEARDLASEYFEDEAAPYLRVADGPLTWHLFFHACDNGVCPSVQFDARFNGEDASLEHLNRWNSEWRFLKAHRIEGTPPVAIIQYDVIHAPGATLDQFQGPLGVWREMLVQFAVSLQPDEAAE